MRQGLFLPLILCVCIPAFADSPLFNCKGPFLPASDAASILDHVQSAYAKVKSLEAGFTQNSYLAALESSEVSSGTVWFLKPGQMKWDYSEPEKQTFLVRDNTLWLYQPADNQVIIDDFQKVLISDVPVSFIMGIGDLKSDFHLRKACKNVDGVMLELEPLAGQGSSESELRFFKLLVNRDDYLPVAALVTDIGGNETTIVFKDMKLNPEFARSVFDAAFAKGVDIVDRRVKENT